MLYLNTLPTTADRKQRIREARLRDGNIRQKVQLPGGLSQAFGTVAEAAEILKAYLPPEVPHVADAVYQTTDKADRELWQTKLLQKADVGKRFGDLREQWDKLTADGGDKAPTAHEREASMFNVLCYMDEKKDLAIHRRHMEHKRQKLIAQQKTQQQRVQAAQKPDDKEVVTIEVTCPVGVVAGQTRV
jgi:hypothetical protein